MSVKKHSRARVVGGVVASTLIFVAAGWLFFNQQFVKDQVSVWSYTRTSEIQSIEDRVDFSGQGSFYFLASQPKLANADDFNQDCPRQEIGSPILGCYSEGRISIYDITNKQLDGIEEVTAAHETLHAIWERMSSGEQQQVGSLLRTEYAKLTDPELKDRMDYYARTEPGEFENELHSIIGTELSGIGQELEQYYAKYFTDRQKVLDLHSKYNAVFKNLSTKSESLYTELVSLGKDITTRSARYNTDATQLTKDIKSFNSRADSGSFSSMAQFYSERAALVARTDQLQADRTLIKSEIASYNSKYDEYQKLAVQIEKLNNSIDSVHALDPAPSL